ncbi:MAG: DUF4446 family protein [Patescibacteria group bacterium]|jgi:hypothetical protein
MSESWQYIVLGIIAFWLFALSISLFLVMRFFNRLTKDSKKGDLKKILEKVLSTGSQNSKDISALQKELERLEEDGRLHVQKVGLIRFNPFQETGGDHSFSIALLNAKDSGIVLTGLHTRERTRVYVKSITKGKSEHELSAEEKKALTKAQKKG